MNTTQPILQLRDIHRSFGGLEVLRGLNLQVHRGEIHGFLGRNGAGKSTAIRILLGITQADKGDVEIFGKPLSTSLIEARRRIGYVAQTQHFYRWMTPTSLGRFVRGFYPGWDKDTYLHLLREFQLPPDRKVGNFSGGMKAKLALSIALSTRPELLVLDEPTAGMDAVARREFLTLVKRQVANSGATVFFSTHHIDDIEAAAQTITITDAGKTLYSGSLASYLDCVIGFTAHIEDAIDEPLPLDAQFLSHAELLGVNEHQETRTVIYRFDDPATAQQFSRSASTLPVAAGWAVQTVSLEDIFVALVTTPTVEDFSDVIA